jgi:hypothetical protein
MDPHVGLDPNDHSFAWAALAMIVAPTAFSNAGQGEPGAGWKTAATNKRVELEDCGKAFVDAVERRRARRWT